MSSSLFLKDLCDGLYRSPKIFAICVFDANSRYRRTFLGPLWPIIAVAMGSVGIASLWSILFNLELEVAIPHITTGFLVWFYLSNTITEGATCFTSNSVTFLSQKTPISVFPLLITFKNTINFVKSLVIVLIIHLFFPTENVSQILWFPAFFLLTISNLYLICYFLGFLSARYQDIAVLTSSVMPMLFFISPVVFKAELLGADYLWVLYANPMSSMLVCLRDPLLGRMPDIIFVYSQLTILFLMFSGSCLLHLKKHKNLPFWL